MIETNLFQSDNYFFAEGLPEAVIVAEFLGKPLLVTGEPGTGKTKLADAIAEVLGTVYGTKHKVRTFNTKSTSVFTDLLYRYHYLKHFHAIQLEKAKQQNAENPKPTEVKIETYIEDGALGEAIKFNTEKSVVLIDEIDKAPRDFPNDILDILEEYAFEVPELDKVGENKYKYFKDEKERETKKPPFILLTSNAEKTLPDAFLRRCIYFNIPFPNDKDLLEILLKHFKSENSWVKENLNEDKMPKIYETIKALRKELSNKQPATAEFILWLKVLENKQFPLLNYEFGNTDKLSKDEKNALKMSFSVLAKNKEDYDNLLKAHNLANKSE